MKHLQHRSTLRSLRVCALAALLLGAFALSGCGSSSKSLDGKVIFKEAGCAGCHTLAAADSHGTTGPNLDKVAPNLISVEVQVTNGGGGMPSFDGDLTPKQITAVSKFVADNVGSSAGE